MIKTAKPRWIPVWVQMPEYDEDILVLDMFKHKAYPGRRSVFGLYAIGAEPDFVPSHWMHTPEHLKGDNH